MRGVLIGAAAEDSHTELIFLKEGFIDNLKNKEETLKYFKVRAAPTRHSTIWGGTTR